MMALVDEARAGSVRALARLITLVEQESEGFGEALKALYPLTGRARVIGVTGPPGVGKSTLVGCMAEQLAKRQCSIGIVAVDPSSPISSGSLLGDRIRMNQVSFGDQVYMRSLSSRGARGGVSEATENVVRILDAVGRDVIIIETVGAGQTEGEVMRIAHTSLVVLAPGQGDEIQALKAGITEVADIVIVNKADVPGAQRYVEMLRRTLVNVQAHTRWVVPVVETVAARAEGIETLLTAIEDHGHHVKGSASVMEYRRDRLYKEIVRRVEKAVETELMRFLEKNGDLELIVHAVADGRLDPYSGAEAVVSSFFQKR